MKTKTLTAAAVILAVLPALGWAQQPMTRPQMPQVDFATADADHSGGISAEEWATYTRSLMQTMRSERIAQRADALIAAADANGDGSLTRDELIAGMTTMADQRQAERGQMHGEGDRMRGGERDGMRGNGHGDRRGAMGGERGRGHEGRGGWGRDGDREGQGMDHGAMMRMMMEHMMMENGMRGGMGDGQMGRGHGMMGGGMMGGRMGQGMGHGGGEGRMGQDGPRGAMMDPADRAARSFERIDQNGDGQISADELAAASAWMQRHAPAAQSGN